MKLEAVACVTVADSYVKGVISLMLVAGERTTQREIERVTFSVNKKQTATGLTQMWTQASRRLPPSSGRGNLLTLWCNGEILGASECFAFGRKRIVLCSCWRTWQEQMGIPPTKNRHRDTSSADEDVNEQSTKNQHKESHAFWLFSCVKKLKIFIKVRRQDSVIWNCTMLYKKRHTKLSYCVKHLTTFNHSSAVQACLHQYLFT